MRKIINEKLPDLEDYFIRQSLYIEYEFAFDKMLDPESRLLPVRKTDAISFLKNLEDLNSRINGFCKLCLESRTFISEESIRHTENWRKSNDKNLFHEGLIVNEFKCAYDDSHRVYFITKINANGFQKIGQYYSLTDFQESDYNKYRSIIDNDKIKELNKAVGLYSHEVGIGSFAYLRRIIEYLIEKAHDRVKKNAGWDETNYQDSRIVDRLKLLENELPEFLVKNRELYSILSKGIHELSEELCIDHFPLLKSGIDHILDEELERKKKVERKKADSAEIDRIYNKYKSKEKS